jgi:hypothetical protein
LGEEGGIMARKISLLGLAGVLVVISVGGISMALAAGDITQPETIVTVDTTVKEGFVDVGKKGFSVGDSFMFLDRLTSEADGASVGTAHGQCTFTLRGWALCEAAFFIGDRGEVSVEGAVLLTEETTTFDVPITGGTGEFENVRGSIHIEPTDDEAVSLLTFNLIP